MSFRNPAYRQVGLRSSMEESFEVRVKDFSARRYEMTFIYQALLLSLNNILKIACYCVITKCLYPVNC